MGTLLYRYLLHVFRDGISSGVICHLDIYVIVEHIGTLHRFSLSAFVAYTVVHHSTFQQRKYSHSIIGS